MPAVAIKMPPLCLIGMSPVALPLLPGLVVLRRSGVLNFLRITLYQISDNTGLSVTSVKPFNELQSPRDSDLHRELIDRRAIGRLPLFGESLHVSRSSNF